MNLFFFQIKRVSTHSRLKAAGYRWVYFRAFRQVSTHSRLKAAGPISFTLSMRDTVSTHSRLKAAGLYHLFYKHLKQFQHTAA